MVGLDDKREVTTVLAVSLSGELLFPQGIYAGKTDRCHPRVNILDEWNVTHSINHWSTKETMLEYADRVLAPCMTQHMTLNLMLSVCAFLMFLLLTDVSHFLLEACVCPSWMHRPPSTSRCFSQ